MEAVRKVADLNNPHAIESVVARLAHPSANVRALVAEAVNPKP